MMMTDWLQAFVQSEQTMQLLVLLVDLTFKGALILCAAALVTIALRGTSAAMRHLVWASALCALLVLPVLAVVVPGWHVPVLPDRVARIVERPLPAPPAVAELPPLPPVPRPPLPAEAPVDKPSLPRVQPAPTAEVDGAGAWGALAKTGRRATALVRSNPVVEAVLDLVWLGRWLHWSAWLLLVWMLGVAAILLHLASGVLGIRALARDARPVRDDAWLTLSGRLRHRLGIERPVRLLQSTRSTTPMTWGFRRPTVLMPADAEAWSMPRRRSVLTHELAHVRRWDCLTQTLAHVTTALFWINPLVWIAVRQMGIEREKACDDYVLTCGARPSDYASHLIEIARSVRHPFTAPLGAVAMARPSQLEGRVLAILDAERPRRVLDPRVAAVVAIVTVAAVLPLAAFRPYAVADGAAVPEVPALPEAPALVPGAPSALPALPRWRGGHVPGDSREDLRVPALIGALADEDEEVRRNAVKALGEIEAASAVPALGALLRRDPSAEVRAGAAWALGEIERRSALPYLNDALSDAEVEVRRHAAWALGEIEDPGAVSALGRALRRDEDVEVRATAAWALGEIEDARALGPLTEALNDPAAAVRRKAAWALGRIDLDAESVEVRGVDAVRRMPPPDHEVVRGARVEDDVVVEELGEAIRSLRADVRVVRDVMDAGRRVDPRVRMHMLGIEEHEIDELRRLGFDGVSLDGAIRLHLFDIDPGYIRSMHRLGYRPTVEELIQLTMADVCPAYIAEMASAGYRNLSIEQLVQLRMLGIDCTFVEDVRRAGLGRPTTERLVELKLGRLASRG